MWNNKYFYGVSEIFANPEMIPMKSLSGVPDILADTPVYKNDFRGNTNETGIRLKNLFEEYAQHIRSHDIDFLMRDRFNTKTSIGKRLIDGIEDTYNNHIKTIAASGSTEIFIHSIIPFYFARSVVSYLSGVALILHLGDGKTTEMKQNIKGMAVAFSEDSRLILTEVKDTFRDILAHLDDRNTKKEASILVDLFVTGGQKLITEIVMGYATDDTAAVRYTKARKMYEEILACHGKAVHGETFVRECDLDPDWLKELE
jgi:hypothetical protein